MSFVMGLAWYRQQPTLLVGASAAIMGLVGATAAILLIGWVRDRANVARRRLGGVVAIVALQITFDHFSVQVSGAAHLAGMFAGFVMTLPILFLLRSERRRAGFDVIFRSPGYVRRE
jgi:membrane associated rhomboid family serine protease